MSASKKNEISAIDLFCGVGGLTYGLQQSGVNVVGGFDIDSDCKHAYETNNHTPFFLKDVAELIDTDLTKLWKQTRYRLLAGCAPCQPFSTYSRTRKGNDARWSLLRHFLRLTEITNPQVVTMENVPQLANHQIFEEFVTKLKSLGYRVWWSVIECGNIGIPQTRKRIVLLASLLGKIELNVEMLKKTTTVAQAISDLPPIAAGQESPVDPLHRACSLSDLNVKRLLASKPGGSWRDWPTELKAQCHKRSSGQTYPSVYGRMEWDKCAPTITTQYFGYGNGRFGHPCQNRALSLREGAMLQTFPSSYNLEPSGLRHPTHVIGKMIGNAVPPLLGKYIGDAIASHLTN